MIPMLKFWQFAPSVEQDWLTGTGEGMESPEVQYVSECFIRPKYTPEGSKQLIYLSPWDVVAVFMHYMQKGFLFAKPPAFDTNENQIQELVQKLKESLSVTLVHFYPLAGRLATQKKEENPSDLAFFIDCTKGPGVRFIHASLDLTIDDIILPTDVPRIVGSLFDHGRLVNYAGLTKSLLTVQVTELRDGIFIGCSMNHMAGDGTSLWHFLNSWSEIFQAEGKTSAISRPPVHDRLFPRGQLDPFLSLPFIHHDDDQVIISSKDEADQVIISSKNEADDTMRERIFHFSSESVAKLKAKANAECHTTEISSLQALSAHLWRCITRARNFPSDRQTVFLIIVNVRSGLVPSRSQDCFGNYLQPAMATASCGELLERGLGWAAWLLHRAVINIQPHEWINSWLQTPVLPRRAEKRDPGTVLLGGSPRFNMYGAEFGLRKPVTIRNGSGNKFDGKLIVNPGAEGGGSMDFDICLVPHVMTALECDKEFMETVS